MNAIESIRATLDEMDGKATIAQLKDCTGLPLAELHAELRALYEAGRISLFPHENNARPVDARTHKCGMTLGITHHVYVRRTFGSI